MTNPHTHLQSSAFEARRKALENLFFHERDVQLLGQLRDELAEFEQEHQLGKVSGIVREKVLLDLVKAGVRAETLLAVRFVPMIAVAWADDTVSHEEREAVLKAAEEEGVAPGSAVHGLISAWLDRPLDKRVPTAWREYIEEVARVMPAGSLEEFRERTAKLCRRAAKCDGGVFGVGSISHAERTAIEEFVSAFDKKPEPAEEEKKS